MHCLLFSYTLLKRVSLIVGVNLIGLYKTEVLGV
jgi:hypothetical protein